MPAPRLGADLSAKDLCTSSSHVGRGHPARLPLESAHCPWHRMWGGHLGSWDAVSEKPDGLGPAAAGELFALTVQHAQHSTVWIRGLRELLPAGTGCLPQLQHSQ